MGQSTPLDATKMEEHLAGKVTARNSKDESSGGDSGGASPVLTDGDRSSSNSSRPSGADLSSFAEDRTSPMGENAKPAPRKVTIPEQGISSYKALEEGLQTSSTEDSAPRAKSSPPKIITTTNKSTKSRKTSLRRGKWTVEEEAYVARVIRDFNYGYLDAPAGTTLRTYLSDKLKCDPMRITKKFTGDACIGKRVFHPAVRSAENSAALDQAQAELDALERRWRLRLEMQQRESAKKAAASAAVAAAASSGEGLPSEPGAGNAKQHPVTQTAAWLDRAKSALKEAPTEEQEDEGTDLEGQMQEVERLIHEGPVIQQTSADLPQMLDLPDGVQSPTNESVSSGDPEPADKRMKTAEDAEALVGFLRSVRASAASGAEL